MKAAKRSRSHHQSAALPMPTGHLESVASPYVETTALSAHRCNDVESLQNACRTGCDFIEFDVQRTVDGIFVLLHDDVIRRGRRRLRIAELSFDALFRLKPDVVTLSDALRIISPHANAHVDLKFRSATGSAEAQAAATVVEAMGAGHAIITSRVPSSVQAIRAWSRVHAPDLLVGLSLWPHEVHCARMLRRCDANFIAAHHWAARLHAAHVARSLDLPLMVWTVDGRRALSKWVRSKDAWLVTTNQAEVALSVRQSRRPAQSRRPTSDPRKPARA